VAAGDSDSTGEGEGDAIGSAAAIQLELRQIKPISLPKIFFRELINYHCTSWRVAQLLVNCYSLLVRRKQRFKIAELTLLCFSCYSWFVAVDPFSALQRSIFMSGRGFSYFAETPGLPLSLKCMFNGRALYRFGRNEVAVDDGGYLILNNRQPYLIEIASPTRVETFVLWFPDGWAEEVLRSFNETPEILLANSPEESGANASFFERYTPHDRIVSPKVHTLRAAFKGEETIDDGWLEEKLRELLASMLASQRSLKHRVADLPAVRAATREELWRRVNHARDYLHANLAAPISLSDVAAMACLSPFYLLRVFQAAFGQTPHQYLNGCRLDRAKFLLEKTRIPVTAICLECGFSSLGSFSALFHKRCGMSPRAWRNRHGVVAEENSNIREVYLMGAT
jgi:AraC-like DNA-binding protein